MPAYEVVLRRRNRKDRVQFHNASDTQIGDILRVDGIPWVVVAKEPPFELRRIERIICVPRTVRTLH